MADYKVSKLSLDISTNIQGAIASLSNLQSSLTKTDASTKSAVYSLQKMSGTMSNMGRILSTKLGFGSVQQSLGTLVDWFKKGYDESSKFIENYNLFNVSFKGNTEQALKFQYELNRAFKTNMSETLRYQGFFENLGTSLGITGEQTQVLSENLTKLTYDISSLFNIDVATAYSKLSSGLVGQTKPLRNLGIDVTMQTLQTDLDRLGIDAQVGQLTQAEKVLLRYIAILRQSTNAQGDFARTIETPVNQFRIMNAQINEMTRWFGTLFLGVITKAAPYINAVVIGLKEIFMTFSKLIGFSVDDFNFLGADNGTDAIDGIEGVTDSITKLNKSLYSFDELNNVGSTSGMFGNVGAGSYYDQLAKYIEGYDNGMKDVNITAEKIKDSIFSWLGIFEKADGNLSVIDGSIADLITTVASFTWDTIKNFFINAKLFVDDVAQWFIDNPEWGENIITFATGTAILIAIAKLGELATPLGLIVTSAGFFIANYGKFKDIWAEMTPTQELLSGLVFLAIAAGAAAMAISGGALVPAILSGWGLASAAAAAVGFTLMASGLSGMVSEAPKKTPQQIATDQNRNVYGSMPAPVVQQPIVVVPDKQKILDQIGIPSIDYGDIMYADGGFPSSGQMFIAREGGAEMVGSIGGRTAVANNSQIVEAVSQGVAIAVSSVLGNGGNNTVNIYLDDVLTGTALINSINRATKITGNAVLAR